MDQPRSGTDQSAHERRSGELDGMRAEVGALCAEISALRPDDHDKLRLRAAVDALAAQARNAEVPPERLLIVLKRVTDHVAAAHLGHWHQVMLSEQLVRWAIAAYYQSDNSD